MCGLFSYVGKSSSDVVDLDLLQEIAIVTERRGPHSFGFAWIDSNNTLRHYKQTGRISENLRALRVLLHDAHVLVGHCRYATQGSFGNNLNNHPHPCDSGWIVHNGRVDNYKDLIVEWDLWPITDCDSETIALVAENIVEVNRSEQMTLAVKEVESKTGREPGCAVMGLWQKELVISRRDKPLHVGRTDGGTYYASLKDELPGDVKRFRNKQTISYTFDDDGDSIANRTQFSTVKADW